MNKELAIDRPIIVWGHEFSSDVIGTATHDIVERNGRWGPFMCRDLAAAMAMRGGDPCEVYEAAERAASRLLERFKAAGLVTHVHRSPWWFWSRKATWLANISNPNRYALLRVDDCGEPVSPTDAERKLANVNG